MRLGLGNTLVNGGGLSSDGLSLDLQFAADKTLTARKGPTPVLTRASTATFVGSDGLIQTAAVNAARFDHDPVTLASRGLLIEEGRTNLVIRSQDFSSASWTKSNLTVSGTLYTDPSGASTANEFVEDIVSAAHTCLQSAGTATIGTTYTFSVFVKRKDTSNQFLLIGATNLVSASFISVNLTNGVTATGIGSPAAPINVSSTAYPNGWYRVQFSVVATSAAAITFDIRLSRDGTWANRSYLGDGVQSSLIWGAQVEAGAFPTSYIPTTTSALARSADVCSITGVGFTGMYNATEGSVATQFNLLTPTSDSSFQGVFEFSDGTTSNRMRSSRSNILIFRNTTSGSLNVDINAGTIQPNIVHKAAYGFALNSFALVANNGTVVTDNVATMPTGVNILDLGNNPQSSSTRLNGHVASFRYYKKRLTDVKLKSLTV